MDDTRDAVPEVSIVVPAYNEERRLPGTLARILDYVQKQGYGSEIIVVDDGSRDGTSGAAEGALSTSPVPGRVIRYEPNRGKGFAVRRGFSEARGRILFFSDADLSTPIEEFDRLQTALRAGADLAIGSRALEGSWVEVHQPWYRERMGKTFNLLVQAAVMAGIRDTQCGFKAFRGDVIRPMLPHLVVDGFAFDVEMLYLARRRRFRIAEIPVRWRDDPNTRVSALWDSGRMLLELLKIRWHAVRGGYEAYLGRPVKEAPRC